MIQVLPGRTPRSSSGRRCDQAWAADNDIDSKGARPVDMLRSALGDIPFEVLEEKRVSFACTCSHERAVSLISSIDGAELETILREDKGAAMTCHFCSGHTG
ncbi:MAG: Hsp33 family molecular chaperone HslO [Chloroflexia bacterium]